MDNPQERREADAHWLAGLFDGEGCISMSKFTHHGGRLQIMPLVRIVSSSPEIIAQIERILGEWGVLFSKQLRGPSHIGTKNCWFISMNGMKRSKGFLAAFAPYLRGKRREAELAMEFIAIREATGNNKPYSLREIDIFVEMRELHGYRLRESSETLRESLIAQGKIKSDLRAKGGEAGGNDQPRLQ